MIDLSFLKGTQFVLYVGPALTWIQRRRLLKSDLNVSLIYIPDLWINLPRSAYKYFFPSFADNKEISVECIYAEVRAELGEDISPKDKLIVWYDGDNLVYYDAKSSFPDLLEYIKNECKQREREFDSCIRYYHGRNLFDESQSSALEDDLSIDTAERSQSIDDSDIPPFKFGWSPFSDRLTEHFEFLGSESVEPEGVEDYECVQFKINTVQTAESTFDSHMQKVADEVKLQLRQLLRSGYPVEMILSWLSQNVNLSRLRITKQYKIVLVDYDLEI